MSDSTKPQKRQTFIVLGILLLVVCVFGILGLANARDESKPSPSVSLSPSPSVEGSPLATYIAPNPVHDMDQQGRVRINVCSKQALNLIPGLTAVEINELFLQRPFESFQDIIKTLDLDWDMLDTLETVATLD